MACHWIPASYGPLVRSLGTLPSSMTATPLTLFCWFNPAEMHGGAAVVINKATGFMDTQKFVIETQTGGNIVVRSTGFLGDTAGDATAGTYTVDTWQTAGGVFESANSRTAYLNGVRGTTDTGHISEPLGVDEIQIGGRVLFGGTVFRPFRGCLAHIAIWDMALSDEDMVLLSDGFHLPTDVEPSHLVFYAPLIDEATVADSEAWDDTIHEFVDGVTLYKTEGDDGFGHDAGILETCATSPTISEPPPPEPGTPGSLAESRLRAWTFVLDGHTMYVLDLGEEGTFLYDTVTQQWCRFITDGFTQWDVQNGVMWGNRVVGGDLESFDVWEHKAEALTDNDRGVSFTFVAADVNDTTNVITETAHGMLTGDGPMQLTTTSALPGGLSVDTNYWVIRASSSTFQLAESREAALNGTEVNLTSTGTGTQTLTSQVLQIAHAATGGLQTRSRKKLTLSALRVAGSAGELGNVDGSAMTLRYSDDNGNFFKSAPNSVTLTQGSNSKEIAFRALGSFAAPGRVFELTDVGGPLRIDGVDAEGPGFDGPPG